MLAKNQQFLSSAYSEAAKGMWPRQHSLNAGTVLYRFIDASRTTPALAADGPWWFEFEHFQSIKHFALRRGYSLGYAARLFAAILYEWSEVNAVVRATTVEPLVAWKGKGKQTIVGKDRPPATPELDPRDVNRTRIGLMSRGESTIVSKMTPMQGPNEVYQLYVPGLGRPHFRFLSYFKLQSFEQISTG